MMNNFMAQYQAFRQNPMGFIMQNKMNVNIPQNMMNDPNAIIQHMMNNGQIDPQVYNQAQETVRQMHSNPIAQRFFK